LVESVDIIVEHNWLGFGYNREDGSQSLYKTNWLIDLNKSYKLGAQQVSFLVWV